VYKKTKKKRKHSLLHTVPCHRKSTREWIAVSQAKAQGCMRERERAKGSVRYSLSPLGVNEEEFRDKNGSIRSRGLRQMREGEREGERA